MKIVGNYTNSFSANLDKTRLKDAEIDSYVLNENLGLISGIINTDLLSIQLAVDDSDYDEAVRILSAPASAL